MESYLDSYAPILVHLVFAAGLSAAIIILSTILGERKPNLNKLSAYECGIVPTGDARAPFAVKFYLVAMLFILFDVEAVFFFPWAVIYRDLGWFGFFEMLSFVFVLSVGLAYVWLKGALEW